MNLCISYDHRLVDGAYAAPFMRDIRTSLETWDESSCGADPGAARPAPTIGGGETQRLPAGARRDAVPRGVGSPALPRRRGHAGRRPRDGDPARAPGDGDDRQADDHRGAPPAGGRRGRCGRDRSRGRSTYHGPGQLVCYPILDLRLHGKDVRRYCRNLEEAAIQALARFELDAERIDGLTGVWISGESPRKIASIGVHVSRWVTTHGLSLNVDLDPAPFTEWITACGLDRATFTSVAGELGRPVAVADARPLLTASLADAFELDLERLPAEAGAGLWPQPLHERMGAPA